MNDTISFCSLNTRGLRDAKKRAGLFHWLKTHKSGSSRFVFLPETHSDLAQECKWKTEWGANIVFSHGESNARGVAILCPVTTDCNIVSVDHDMDGRIVLLETNVNGQNILLCNVYAPTQEQGFRQARQMAYLDILKAKLVPYAERDTCVILGGDLNTHLNPKLDKQRTSSPRENSARTEFANITLLTCVKI